jgi:hypothetical protein
LSLCLFFDSERRVAAQTLTVGTLNTSTTYSEQINEINDGLTATGALAKAGTELASIKIRFSQ